MAVNPDPKPGRWILPLVILGMIAFTYFFVGSLPEASPDTTLVAGPSTTTGDGGGSTTTVPGETGSTVNNGAAAYIAELDRINAEFQALNTELVTVNTGFDADPREIEYGDAEPRFEAVATAAQGLSDQVAALAPPPGLESNHETIAGQATLAAGGANDALSGIRSDDPGNLRRAGVTTFTTATTDFNVEVENARATAGATPDA